MQTEKKEECFLHQWNFRHPSGFIVCDACGNIHAEPIKEEKTMREHDGVKYKINPIEVSIATSGDHEEYKTGYDYILLDVIDTYCGYEDYESEEWYDTESEAVIAAENKINWFHDGMEYEGNYEEHMAMKPRDIDWEERRKLGE